MRWGLIKKEFTKQVYTLTGNTPQRLKNKRREGAIWQRRFWEHRIRDQRDYNNHCDYIHYNPVKHGLAHTPNEWEFSSFHRFVKNGYYTKNWCASGANFTTITAGE
jgi:putative transposase